jgi:hypothetical protein
MAYLARGQNTNPLPERFQESVIPNSIEESNLSSPQPRTPPPGGNATQSDFRAMRKILFFILFSCKKSFKTNIFPLLLGGTAVDSLRSITKLIYECYMVSKE